MSWEFITGVLLLVITGVLAVTLALMAYARRPMPGALPLAVCTCGCAVWLLAYAGELSSAGLAHAVTWSTLQYLGIVSVPVGWLCFALDFAGRRHWLTRRVLVLLALPPAITLTLVWTNAWHGLIWRTVALNQQGPFTTLDVTHGSWFWVHTLYSYVALLGGSIFLLSPQLRVWQLYRGQTIGLLVSVLTPWLGNVLYLGGVRPWNQIDLTPLAFLCSCATLAWAVLRLRLLDVVPIAREAVIDNLRDGVVVLDLHSRVVDFNGAAQQIIGHPSTTLKGQMARDVLTAWPVALDALRSTETLREVIVGVGAAQRWYELRVSPVCGRYERISGWLLVWHDISERKRAEATLSAAKDAAEAANRAKSAFLANMSHELRTPLTAILGYCELLELELRQLDHPHVATDLKAIKSAGTHLLGLINSVLDLSKIEVGRVELRSTAFDITLLVQEVVQLVQPLITQHNNTLTVIYGDLGVMWGDKLKIRQVLLNLLSNAAKFTDKGTVTLRVKIESHVLNMEDAKARTSSLSAQPWVIFEVSDTGVGIAPADLPHIFQPFAQASDPMRRTTGSAGLGLAITRHFCTLTGGEIGVVSTPGQGSTFTVWLPRGSDAAIKGLHDEDADAITVSDKLQDHAKTGQVLQHLTGFST